MSTSPEYPPPTLEAAQAALQEQRPADAVPIAEALTAANPENYDAWQTLAVAYAQSGRQADAVRGFNQCVKLRPNLPQPHFNLAQALMAAGEREKARSELELCLSVDPTYVKASQALSQLGPAPAGPSVGLPGLDRPGSYGGGAGSSAPTMQGPLVGQAPPPGPMIGQMPPPFNPGQSPPGDPQYAPPFTPGAAGLAGGQMPPGMPAGFSYQTADMRAVRPDLPGSTRAWCIATIVLAVFYMLGGFGQIMFSAMAATMPGLSQFERPGGAGIGIVAIVLAIAFIVGSAGVLQRKGWGRQTMVVCCGLGLIYQFVNAGMTYSSAGSNPAFTRNPALAANPGAAAAAGLVAAGIALFIGLAYLIPLLIHMSSAGVKGAMLD